jgi:hypothetical protein
VKAEDETSNGWEDEMEVEVETTAKDVEVENMVPRSGVVSEEGTRALVTVVD